MLDIETKIISYREDANDYRLCLTREEINEIKQALNNKNKVDEVKELMKQYVNYDNVDIFVEILRKLGE